MRLLFKQGQVIKVALAYMNLELIDFIDTGSHPKQTLSPQQVRLYLEKTYQQDEYFRDIVFRHFNFFLLR
jgi:hypothetical protein